AVLPTAGIISIVGLRRQIKLNGSVRRWLFRYLAALALFCQFGIQFCAYENGEARPVKPHHQGHCCAQSSISFVEVAKMAEVDSQPIRKADPRAYRQDGSRQGTPESLFYVGREVVKKFNRQHCKKNCHRPMDIRPEYGEQPGEMHSSGKPSAKFRADDHHAQGGQQERAHHQRKPNRQRTGLPKWTVVYHLVSDVEGFNRGGKTARGSP